jgi:hypothetical protein
MPLREPRREDDVNGEEVTRTISARESKSA